jgi:hypothetical protein
LNFVRLIGGIPDRLLQDAFGGVNHFGPTAYRSAAAIR